MSAQPVTTRQPAAEPARLKAPRLVAAPRRGVRSSRGAFALIVTGLLSLGLLGLLALNTELAQGSFEAQDLSSQIGTLTDQAQSLEQEVAVLESPQELAARARALGMVPSTNPVFLDTRTGKVEGVPVPAAPRPRPVVTTGSTR